MKHVDDIDLLVGATLEKRTKSGILGPTTRCLVAEQFYRSRVGDRYFYDHMNFAHSFTPGKNLFLCLSFNFKHNSDFFFFVLEQLEEITKSSLARLFCEMGGAVTSVQANPFKVKSIKNPLINCRELPSININLWKE